MKRRKLRGGTNYPLSHEMRRGDIFYVRATETEGSEQGGDRPAVIVSNDTGNRYAPAEDVALVRHGKLVEITLDEDLCNNGFCSECGGKNTAIAKYCNWCGVKLDGGGDGEN